MTEGFFSVRAENKINIRTRLKFAIFGEKKI